MSQSKALSLHRVTVRVNRGHGATYPHDRMKKLLAPVKPQKAEAKNGRA